MQLKILGCSGAKSVGKSPTCFLIDNKILIDCGSVVSKLESSFIVENIDCLFLTHSHFDHILELPFLLELILEKGRIPFNVYASEESINSLYSNVFNYELWPDLFEISAKKDGLLKLNVYKHLNELSVSEYKVTPVRVNHTVDTHGLILDSGESSIAFTGDTYITDSFWKECNNKSNLKAVIVDVSFPSSMKESASITKHMSTDILIQELEKLNSRDVNILISHMKPQLTDQIKAELKDVSQQYSFTYLEDGMVLEI